MPGDLSTPRTAWLWLAFLTLLNVVNMVDRQLISGFGPAIRDDLGLDLAQIGLLAGLSFIVFYSIVGLWLGAAADRFSRPLLIAGGLLLWSAMTAASGWAQNFWHLFVARMLVGVGEATLTPAAISMLSDVFPAHRRGLAAGIYYLGVPFGVGLSLTTAGLLGPAMGGWRPCFCLLGGIGIPLAIATAILRDPRGKLAVGAGSTMQSLREAVRTLWASSAAVATILGGVAILFGVSSMFFDVIWLTGERGFDQPSAAKFLGVAFLIGGIFGNLGGGWIGDLCQCRHPSGRLRFLAWGQLILCPIALVYRLVPGDSPWFFVMAVFSAVSLTFFYGPLFAAVQDFVPSNLRSSAVAILILAVNLVGLAPGAFFAGRISDVFRDQGVFEPVTFGLFVTVSAGLTAVPLFLLASRRVNAEKGHYQ